MGGYLTTSNKIHGRNTVQKHSITEMADQSRKAARAQHLRVYRPGDAAQTAFVLDFFSPA
jgi:hypothetical protein